MVKLTLESKILNTMMNSGNKKTCEKLFLKSIKLIQKSSEKSHKTIIKRALINSSPLLRTKQIKLKRKKKLKEFIFFVNKKNRLSLAIKAIIAISNNQQTSQLHIKLKEEIYLSFQNKSRTIEKRNLLHEQALTNKKYLRYRWY